MCDAWDHPTATHTREDVIHEDDTGRDEGEQQ